MHSVHSLHSLQSYIPCPDEKGTERFHQQPFSTKQIVTFLAPMKRGLKVNIMLNRAGAGLSYIPCPDEKGTESYQTVYFRIVIPNRYIPCPDEKGTER